MATDKFDAFAYSIGLFQKPKKERAPRKPRTAADLQAVCVMVYSGKGGVGKTTTTANLARALADAGRRVMVVDMDVNTPSMQVVFPVSNVSDNLLIESIGYEHGGMFYIEGAMVTKYITGFIKKAKTFKPDIILIDTPPSIADVHITLMQRIKLSGLLLVTQPNALSRQDVFKTVTFFTQKNVPILGIVENMTTEKDTSIEYDWSVLGRVPFANGFDFDAVYAASKKVYTAIAERFGNLEQMLFEEQMNTATNEDIEWDEISREATHLAQQNKLRFINLNTWEDVKDAIAEHSFQMLPDRLLSETTTERMRRMIEAFEGSDRATFLITNAPRTEIPLFAGEIGEATLLMGEQSHYGIPRIKYHTSAGDVILFPHECMPATMQIIQQSIDDGSWLHNDGRYIPSKDVMRQIENAYGARVGVCRDWEELYDQQFEGKY